MDRRLHELKREGKELICVFDHCREKYAHVFYLSMYLTIWVVVSKGTNRCGLNKVCKVIRQSFHLSQKFAVFPPFFRVDHAKVSL